MVTQINYKKAVKFIFYVSFLDLLLQGHSLSFYQSIQLLQSSGLVSDLGSKADTRLRFGWVIGLPDIKYLAPLTRFRLNDLTAIQNAQHSLGPTCRLSPQNPNPSIRTRRISTIKRLTPSATNFSSHYKYYK